MHFRLNRLLVASDASYPCSHTKGVGAFQRYKKPHMPGTSLGIFWIDLICKPVFKSVLKSPELAMMILMVVYSCIAYKCMRSAWLDNQ